MTTPEQPGPPGWPPAYPPRPPPGWGQPAYGYAPYAPAPRNNPLAIVSLVAGLAQPFFWFVGAVTAIITGHIARGQIRRTGEGGGGMALAGIILGYVGLAATGLLVLLLIGLFSAASHLAPIMATGYNRNEAFAFADQVSAAARQRDVSPRNVAVIQAAAAERSHRAISEEFHLPDGTALAAATLLDFQRNKWRVEMSTNSELDARPECITIPPTFDAAPSVIDGPCALLR